jgi:hypothetical protein
MWKLRNDTFMEDRTRIFPPVSKYKWISVNLSSPTSGSVLIWPENFSICTPFENFAREAAKLDARGLPGWGWWLVIFDYVAGPAGN